MRKKFILLIMFIISIISLTACWPIHIGPLTVGRYNFEGYVLDLETDEVIEGAKVVLADEVTYTDEEGYFNFKRGLKSVTPSECSAEGYGMRTLGSMRLDYDTINIIYLLKKKGIYGYTSYKEPQELEVLLKGQTIEGKKFQETTEFDDNGYFYIREIPHQLPLDLYVYDKDEDEEAAYYSQKTDPVEISQKGTQYFYISERRVDK